MQIISRVYANNFARLHMLMTVPPKYMTTTSTHVHQHTCKPPLPQTQKNLKYLYLRFLLIQTWRCPTLTWGNPTLPSALQRFTSKFGMDLGGSTALSPPRYSVDVFSCLLYSSVLPSVLSSLSHFNQKQAV